MTTATTTSHIVLDERGTAFIEGKRTRVAQVVMDKMNGMTPEDIHRNYPYLSLAEIHAAFAYYYDHQAAIDVAIARDLEAADRLRVEAIAEGKQLTRKELEARRKARGNN